MGRCFVSRTKSRNAQILASSLFDKKPLPMLRECNVLFRWGRYLQPTLKLAGLVTGLSKASCVSQSLSKRVFNYI